MESSAYHPWYNRVVEGSRGLFVYHKAPLLSCFKRPLPSTRTVNEQDDSGVLCLGEEMTSGIYAIANTINGKRYIGSSVDIHKRWREHLQQLRKGCHHSRRLQNAWNKYGENAFSFTILQEISDRSLLIRAEEGFLQRERPQYNILPHAGPGKLGHKISEESKRKIGESNRAALAGRKLPDSVRERIVAALYGRPRSQETKRKASESLKAWYQTAEGIKKKQSRQPLGIETRRKIGDAHRGKAVSTGTRQRLSEVGKGKTGWNANAAKPVSQFTKDGQFIALYPSAREAGKITGVAFKHIGSCCKGNRKSCGGFVWKYADQI